MAIIMLLIMLGVTIFVILGCYTLFTLVLLKIKEKYLMEHGYQFKDKYWCKEDRSLAGDWVWAMSLERLMEYVERAEELDSNDRTNIQT